MVAQDFSQVEYLSRVLLSSQHYGYNSVVSKMYAIQLSNQFHQDHFTVLHMIFWIF